MFCGNCGSKIFEGDAFCCNCGAKAGGGAVGQQPPQPIVSPVQPQPVSKVPQPTSIQPTAALWGKLMKQKWVIIALVTLLLLGIAIGAVLIFTDLGRPGYEAELGSTDDETILATHTITVRLNFPGAEDAPPLVITEGTTIAELPTPERPGYTFTHWTSDSVGQNVLPPETPITEDSTLYAQWRVEDIDPYSLFSDLLAQYREIVENQYFMDDRWLGELQEQELSTDWLWWLNWQTHMRDGSIPAYFAFYDINNNGIPDLILGSGTEHRSTVLGIHTWVDGETYLLEINPHGSWLGERANIFISQDGIIVNSGSSSALSGGATFFAISTDGRSVDIVDELWHDLHEVFDWSDDWDEDLWGAPDDRRGFFRGDEEITEEEYDEIFLQFFGVRSEQWDVAWENELVLEWHPIVAASGQADVGILSDWQEWFSTSFEEWFGDNAPGAEGLSGGDFFQHPTDDESWILFPGIDGITTTRLPTDYPVMISIPISRLLGRPFTSVAELRDIFGESFSVEYNDGYWMSWIGQVEMDGFHLFFLLASEHDADIRWVDISPPFD